MRALAYLFLLLVLPLASCRYGPGPQAPPPGSAGRLEPQVAMPETTLLDENQPGDGGGGGL